MASEARTMYKSHINVKRTSQYVFNWRKQNLFDWYQLNNLILDNKNEQSELGLRLIKFWNLNINATQQKESFKTTLRRTYSVKCPTPRMTTDSGTKTIASSSFCLPAIDSCTIASSIISKLAIYKSYFFTSTQPVAHHFFHYLFCVIFIHVAPTQRGAPSACKQWVWAIHKKFYKYVNSILYKKNILFIMLSINLTCFLT